jgi:hypothetical protein
VFCRLVGIRNYMSFRFLIAAAGVVVLVWLAVVLIDAALVSPAWSSHSLASLHFLLLVGATLLTLVLAILGLVVALSRRSRPGVSRLHGAALLAVSVGAALGAESMAVRIRMAGFARCAERLAPLVSAIRDHETRFGTPPARLEDLVPGYLNALPSTGLGAYSDVEYSVGSQPSELYGNRWMLSIPAFRASWDQLVFLPNGEYPALGFGGSLERVADWAYVHE